MNKLQQLQNQQIPRITHLNIIKKTFKQRLSPDLILSKGGQLLDNFKRHGNLFQYNILKI